MRSPVFCSILLFSFTLAANAQEYYRSVADISPYPRSYFPFPTQDNSSLENIEKNLKASQASLQDELTRTNQNLQSLQAFLAAQKLLKLTWITVVNNQKISDALNVSYDGKKTQICRAKFLTGTHPGLVTSSGCLITYGGYAALMPSYEVLTGKVNTQWKTIPIQGGFENNLPLYVCKVTYNGVAKVGKVIGDVCDIADESKEIPVHAFEVLFGEI
jgi:hypothetical protein